MALFPITYTVQICTNKCHKLCSCHTAFFSMKNMDVSIGIDAFSTFCWHWNTFPRGLGFTYGIYLSSLKELIRVILNGLHQTDGNSPRKVHMSTTDFILAFRAFNEGQTLVGRLHWIVASCIILSSSSMSLGTRKTVVLNVLQNKYRVPWWDSSDLHSSKTWHIYHSGTLYSTSSLTVSFLQVGHLNSMAYCTLTSASTNNSSRDTAILWRVDDFPSCWCKSLHLNLQ